MKLTTNQVLGSKRYSIIAVGLLFAALLFSLSIVDAAPAPVNLMSAAPHYQTLDIKHYQFRGTTTSGSPISDGTHTVVFSIWDDSTSGILLWNETQLITTTDGLGAAQIGSLVPIPLSVLSLIQNDSTSARFLQVEIDGEPIVPRARLVATPYANVSERILGDVVTGPGLIELTPSEELVGSYNFLLENHNTNGTMLLMQSPSDDSGISVELTIGEDMSGDQEARLSFFGTDGSRPKKPKEIVVVGSKVKEVVRYYENATEDEVATREHVSGRATGKRVHSPFRVTGAQLPDTTPAYDLSVDSAGGELFMSKNNTDGSSCWIRVATVNTASHELHSADASSSSSKTEESSPKGSVMYLDVTETSGNSAQVNEYVSVDSGYGRTTTTLSGSAQTQSGNMMDFQEIINSNSATDGSSSTQTVDAIDYALWRESISTTSGSSSGQLNEFLSVDSAYERTLDLTDGSSSTQTVDAIDYAVWRRNFGASTTSGQSASMSKEIGIDSGFNESILMSDAAGNQAELTHVVQQSGGEAAAISTLRTLVTTQSLFSETKLDSTGSSWLLQAEDNIIARAGKRLTKSEIITELTSSSSSNEFSDDDNNTLVQSEATTTSSKLFVGGLSWDGVAGEDGVSTTSSNGRKTVRAHDFMSMSTDTGAVFEMAAADDEATMYLGSGDAGFDGAIEASVDSTESELRIRSSLSNGTYAGMYSDASSNSLRFSQVLPSRAIADKIALEQTSASSKLYVGNLGFGSNDGVNISSTPAAGAQIGIGTNAPSVALHVVGSICYTGGITSCSDGRYKDDIETIPNALELVENLRGVEYKWKKDDYPDMRFSDGQQLGLVAQEVKEILPELVSEDADGYYSVDYVKLTPILIEAIKEQQKTIEELKKSVSDKDQLTERLNKLERLVSAIVEKN